MSMMQMLLGASDASLSIEDIFSIKEFTGNGTTGQTITNGINLSGEGGLVISKCRNQATWFNFIDTEEKNSTLGRKLIGQFAGNGVWSEITSTWSDYGIQQWNTDGYELGKDWSGENKNTKNMISYTFRKAEKFFDIVTYEGDGSTSTAQEIDHNLGAVPGMILIKKTHSNPPNHNFNTGEWSVYHKSMIESSHMAGASISADGYILLNTGGRVINTTASGWSAPWNDTAPTSTKFYVISDDFTGGGGWPSFPQSHQCNDDGCKYVAYLFGTDTDFIKCGYYTGSFNANSISGLGFKPGFVMVKDMEDTQGADWILWDESRGVSSNTTQTIFKVNGYDSGTGTTEVETSNYVYSLTFDNDGFTINNGSVAAINQNGTHYLYLAVASQL